MATAAAATFAALEVIGFGKNHIAALLVIINAFAQGLN